MAREDGLVEFPASPKQLEEALERLYKGQTNVAVQAQGLGMPLERLKQILTAYVVARPIDWNVSNPSDVNLPGGACHVYRSSTHHHLKAIQ